MICLDDYVITSCDTDIQLIPREAGSCSTGQEIPSFYKKRMGRVAQSV